MNTINPDLARKLITEWKGKNTLWGITFVPATDTLRVMRTDGHHIHITEDAGKLNATYTDRNGKTVYQATEISASVDELLEGFISGYWF